MFMKYKLEEQGKIDPGGVSHFIFMAHNEKMFGMPFMTSLSNNVEATFSGRIFMFQSCSSYIQCYLFQSNVETVVILPSLIIII